MSYAVFSDGRVKRNATTPDDLVTEWIFPMTVELDVWLNVYSGWPDVSTHPTREAADLAGTPQRIACLHIEREVVEGTDLD